MKETREKPRFVLLQKIGRIMGIALSVLIALAFILIGTLFWYSPGKINPVVDKSGQPMPGSISEKIWVPINGVDQGMVIQSKDPNNLALLFMHGGPGIPEYFLTEQYPTGLEDDFTIVWWDQRGAGLSYQPDIPPETMTVEKYISDTIAVTNYLRNRFHQEKIYLMAHSGGAFFAIQAVQRAPELFHAYISVGQIVYQLESEKIAYEFMLGQYQQKGDTRMVEKLQAASPTLTYPLPAAYDRIRDNAMHGIGVGTTREMKTIEGGVFFPSWFSKQFTLGEKINLWKGKVFCANTLRKDVFATDLREKVTRLDVPIYFVSGKYDYTVNNKMSKSFLAQLDAPIKGFYTFENSAHSPFFEEPDQFRKVLREDVMAGTTTLADKP